MRLLFPELASFISGWFHQDFDIRGDTLEEVVSAFKAESDAELVAPLVADIDAFLATGNEGMEDRFQDCFRPDVIPTSFRPTTREFLVAIRAALVEGKDGIGRSISGQCPTSPSLRCGRVPPVTPPVGRRWCQRTPATTLWSEQAAIRLGRPRSARRAASVVRPHPAAPTASCRSRGSRPSHLLDTGTVATVALFAGGAMVFRAPGISRSPRMTLVALPASTGLVPSHQSAIARA